MPNLINWMGEDDKAGRFDSIHGTLNSVHITHRMISEKPVSIVVVRNGAQLPAQTVRIETTRIAPDRDIAYAAREGNANAVLIGYKDHPTIADTDLKAGDRFELDGLRFEVRHIFPQTPGSLQAWLEVID